MIQSVIDAHGDAARGEATMQWYRAHMPIITKLKEEFTRTQPFKGLVFSSSFHTEPKTAYWMEAMLAGGAEHIYLAGNLGSTRPDIAALLASYGRMTVLAKEQDSYEDLQGYLNVILQEKADIFLDNGAGLIIAHTKMNPGWKPLGANEETRTGRLLIEKEGIEPGYPVIVVDDSPVKWMLENAIGVGQGVVDAYMRTTSLLVAGKKTLVVGYGHVGSGVAEKFRAFGAHTMVADLDPVKMLKARADGHRVGKLEELLPHADIVVTVTGCFDIITPQHIPLLRPDAVLANAGHYGFEIDRAGLLAAADSVQQAREKIEAFRFGDKTVYLIGRAELVNLSGADGNAIEIMDIGFGLQACSALIHATDRSSLEMGMQAVPRRIDERVSLLALES